MKFRVRDFLLATVAYADVFDWPLTQEELERWCIRVQPRSLPQTSSRSLLRRRSREFWAKPKWKKARRTARFLSIIPTLELIGVTGGLARNNVKRNDDIDLFLIAQRGTLWVSRLLAIIVCELLDVRRRPGDTQVADKICLNMFMSEEVLALPKTERDLFAAYEVLQMQPLWERGGVYQKFLFANQWTKKFLPNAWEWRVNSKQLIGDRQNKNVLFSVLEPLARAFQLWYMKRHRTHEVITDTMIRFHPNDARVWIKGELGKRLARFKIPLDKIFYGS